MYRSLYRTQESIRKLYLQSNEFAYFFAQERYVQCSNAIYVEKKKKKHALLMRIDTAKPIVLQRL